MQTSLELKYFHLDLLSRYRTQLMGVAAIFILLCHANGNGVEMPQIVKRVLTFGNYGVDIFLLLSGIGLYYSLSNSHKQTLTSWYKRRFIRLLVPYLLFSVPYWLYINHIENGNIMDFIINLSTISYWTNHRGAWFIALIIPLYMLSPIIMNCCKSRYGISFLILSIVIFSMIPSLSATNNAIVDNIIFASSRIPCFILGFLLAIFIKKKYKIKTSHLATLCILICIIYKLLSIYHIDVYWILTIPIIVISTILLYILSNINICNVIFTTMGTISLESYLSNIYLGDIFRQQQIFDSNLVMYSLVIVTGIISSLIINRVSNIIIRSLQNRHTI